MMARFLHHYAGDRCYYTNFPQDIPGTKKSPHIEHQRFILLDLPQISYCLISSISLLASLL